MEREWVQLLALHYPDGHLKLYFNAIPRQKQVLEAVAEKILEYASPLEACHANNAELQALWFGIKEIKWREK